MITVSLKSPRAHVTSDGVNSTVCAWKIAHWKPHTTVKLKPHMRTNSESVHTFILNEIATHNHKKNLMMF